MTIDDLFINGKKLKLDGKTSAQLEHALQLAKDEKSNYARIIRNYSPEKMEKYGRPFMDRLDRTIAAIEQAINNS